MSENNVVLLNKIPSRYEVERMIKKLTENGQISLSGHCKKRMNERDITIQEIIVCLLKGKVIEDPVLSHRQGGGYETTVERFVAGTYLKIGICLKFNQRILVITAIKY